MPIYEYACNACSHRFDVRQSFSDDPVASCPSCGASVRRVLHPAGVIFKGSGWYITDSRKGSAKSESTGASSASTSDSGTVGSKAEAAKEPVKAAADD